MAETEHRAIGVNLEESDSIPLTEALDRARRVREQYKQGEASIEDLEKAEGAVAGAAAVHNAGD